MNSRPFTISFFGSSLLSAYWNGAATYYRGIIAALYRRGHRSVFYEPDAYDRQLHRDLDKPEYAASVVYPAGDESALRRALAAARNSDIVVKASGVGVFDELLEEAVAAMKGTLRVFWDVDAPATLDRIAANPNDPFRNLIPAYDLIFTYGGGPPVVQAYLSFGAKRCVPIYNALDPDTHHPVPYSERFCGKLGFLGNRMPDREARVHEFFFKTARAMPGHRFLLGGNGWEANRPELANIVYHGHVYTRDHNAFNCSPLAVLNISRDSMASYGFSPATRVFEAAGAGGCVITDAWEGIDLFLEPGRECLVAAKGEEVVSLLQDLTAEGARRIGARARKRMLSEHTYTHRAAQVEAVLAEIAGG